MKIANGMQFVNDEAVIGKWNNIGWIENTYCTSLDGLNEKSGEYDTIYFLPNGEPYWIFEGWTKGVLLIHYGGNEPILTYKYDIQVIDGKEYLFLCKKTKPRFLSSSIQSTIQKRLSAGTITLNFRLFMMSV